MSGTVPITFFFFNDTATTEIYTLSLHDALPIFLWERRRGHSRRPHQRPLVLKGAEKANQPLPILPRIFPILAQSQYMRSEEHTSELQSQSNLVCRLLLETNNKQDPNLD